MSRYETVADLIAELQKFDPFMRVAHYYHSGYNADLPAMHVEKLVDHGGYLSPAYRAEDEAKAGDWLVIS